MHGTRPRVFAAQDEFLAAGEEQFALYRVDTVVGGGDGDRLAGQETVGVAEGFVRQCRGLAAASHLQGFLRTHLGWCAMAEAEHPSQPGLHLRVIVDQRRGDRRALEEPQAVRHGEVGDGRFAEQEIAVLARQLALQSRHECRPLVARLFQRQAAGAAAAE